MHSCIVDGGYVAVFIHYAWMVASCLPHLAHWKQNPRKPWVRKFYRTKVIAWC